MLTGHDHQRGVREHDWDGDLLFLNTCVIGLGKRRNTSGKEQRLRGDVSYEVIKSILSGGGLCCGEARSRLVPIATPWMFFKYAPIHGTWPIKVAVLPVNGSERGDRRLPKTRGGKLTSSLFRRYAEYRRNPPPPRLKDRPVHGALSIRGVALTSCLP